MTINKTQAIQIGLNLIILLLLAIILLPAWQTAQARFAVDSGQESGKTLAERYLILGDWPSGNTANALLQFDRFQMQNNDQSTQMSSTTMQQNAKQPPETGQ
ncbi:hypothetical protein KDN34_05720 [Shewanella yunxiaonensis]|uniref:Uncharacterized protein n=1 Tax=Shewanella yunxiaonensis TaxID=2829809 RepID=A0ABX7YWB5_9GAMM|nr:hypothetical protein [Shewanella yunxiaonensis]QUN06940.1 hypothetical protein KDN34_05720 [Shewanella yunxiaonensis]